MSPFDIAKHINEKTNLEFDFKDYAPWMINRILSLHQQTIFYANEINKLSTLDKDIQYSFYYDAIPKGKRFGKWHKKPENSDLIRVITAIYNCNEKVAEQYLSLLSDEQKQKMSEKSNKGGKNGGANSK